MRVRVIPKKRGALSHYEGLTGVGEVVPAAECSAPAASLWRALPADDKGR